MARKPGTERRREIAAAVLAIIGERGATALSTATIAAQVGVTTGALFRHFGSLDEILDETTRLAVVEIEATFPDPGLPGRERLSALVRARVALLADRPGLAWLLLSDQAAHALPPPAVARLRALVKRSREFLQAALTDALAAGTLRRDIAPEDLLVIVTGTVHALIGAGGIHARGRPRRDPERVLSALDVLLDPEDSSSPRPRRLAKRVPS